MSIRDRLPRLSSPLGWRNAERFASTKPLQGGIADHFAPAPPAPSTKRLRAVRRALAAEQARRTLGR